MNKFEITASCTFGMESILKREIIKLGYEIKKSSDGAVTILGDINDVYRLNLWLRTANRVLIHIATFPANSFDELYDNVKLVEWENYFKKNDKCNVSKISCVKSKLFSKSDSQRIIKKAIVDRLCTKYKTKRLPENASVYPLFVTIKNDICTLSLNTSGESLHRRGYRLSAGEAPMKETLAAGIIRLAGYEGNCQFADFMCGSGTFIIEAALIAGNIAPGKNRSFAFEDWNIISQKDKDAILGEAIENEKKVELRLLGSDIDGGVLKSARQNAIRAGVEDMVSFQKLNFSEFKSRKKNGIICVNPPYGERIGKGSNLKGMYADMKRVYDELENWKMFILCANPEFQKDFGKKADKNRKLYNGNMLTYLYEYF